MNKCHIKKHNDKVIHEIIEKYENIIDRRPWLIKIIHIPANRSQNCCCKRTHYKDHRNGRQNGKDDQFFVCLENLKTVYGDGPPIRKAVKKTHKIGFG